MDIDRTGWVDYPDYPHVAKLLLLLFCSYVLIWYLQIGNRIDFLGKIRIEFVVACLLTPLAILNHNKGKRGISTPLVPLVILYYIILLTMTFFSYDIQTSWSVFFNRVVKFSFMALFITCFVKSPRDLRYFLAAFILACLKMGQEGFVGNLTGNMVWQNQGVMRLHGSTELYFHPNSFSGMALGTIPFVIYLFPIAKRWIKAVLLVQLVFACNIIIFTASRTGWVGLIGMCAAIFVRSKKKFLLICSLVLILAIGVQVVPEQYHERFQSIFYSTNTESISDEGKSGIGSIQSRIQILKDAIPIFMDNPLGVGVGAFPAIRMDIYGRSQDTHNLYLEIATNLGVQGIVIFSLLVFYLFKTLFLVRREMAESITKIEKLTFFNDRPELHDAISEHISDVRLLMAVCDSIILFILIRLFLGLFGMDLYEIYWWFALGVTLSLANMVKIVTDRNAYILTRFNFTVTNT